MVKLFDNPKSIVCPKCSAIGYVHVNQKTSKFRCSECLNEGFQLSEEVTRRLREELPQNMPRDTLSVDFLLNKSGLPVPTVAYYVPRVTHQPEEFDPTSNQARAVKVMYRTKIRNRKRHNRLIIDRARKEGSLAATLDDLTNRSAGAILMEVQEWQRRRSPSSHQSE